MVLSMQGGVWLCLAPRWQGPDLCTWYDVDAGQVQREAVDVPVDMEAAHALVTWAANSSVAYA